MNQRIARHGVALLVCVVLLLGALPAGAFAAERGPLAAAVTYQGTVLTGMAESELRTHFAANTAVPDFGTVTVAAAHRSYTFDARQAVAVDIDKMVAAAYSATSTVTPTEVPAFYKTRGTVVSGWVASIASKVNRSSRNAWWLRDGHRMSAVPSVNGRRVNRDTTVTRVRSAIAAQFGSPGEQIATVTASVSTLTPAITRRNLGKAIVVDLSERKVYLWRVSGLEKTYRCAIGMSAYPTPRGSFKIIAKAKYPTWRNPGSDWATSMPAYIAPGPNNPLGLRALYLNAPGIRIHGTSNYASIGTAASHGCMRLKNPDVVDIYPRVPVGTPVRIIK